MIFLKNYSGEMDQVLMFKNDKNLQKISNLNTGPYGPVYRGKNSVLKALDAYFQDMKFLMQNFAFFMPFYN